MFTLTKTMTLTSLAIIVAIFSGAWLASTSPANSRIDTFQPAGITSMSVENRLGAIELDICQGQAWPHFSEGCAAWIAATSGANGIDRTVSTVITDIDHGFTVAGKAQPVEVAAR